MSGQTSESGQSTESEQASESGQSGESLPTDDTVDGTGGRPCPLCAEPMVHRHCKYVCPTHGVIYDCSDTFY
ncbi:hypothetical protein GWK26_11045 [haloarchaeon 3A1-DGR]|nr:hypothetical protein GWK26_11045 [haloarchaeon 3A1-DGR]